MHTQKRVPGYLCHKPSSRGYAVFGPRGSKPTYFPGPHGSAASLAAYHAALAEHLAGGRPARTRLERLTVRQLLAEWFHEADRRYRKFGRPTGEMGCQKSAMHYARLIYADLPADEFGPVQLAAVRQKMIEAGWVRTSINLHVCRIRAVWKWAASRDAVPTPAYQSLCTLSGLRAGKTGAREAVPRVPATWRQLLAVLRRCAPAVGAMIRLQYLSGMRPGEVCALRPCDLDRSRDEWRYKVRPEAAKTGKEVYWFGPRARAVLAPWLLRAAGPDAKVFGYATASYRRHVTRCCRAAGCECWTPHQLRHNCGSRVADRFGREVAARSLNHAQVKTTERYTRTADAAALRVAREMG